MTHIQLRWTALLWGIFGTTVLIITGLWYLLLIIWGVVILFGAFDHYMTKRQDREVQ